MYSIVSIYLSKPLTLHQYLGEALITDVDESQNVDLPDFGVVLTFEE